MVDNSEQSITSPIEERIAKISHIGPWELGKVVGRGSSGTVHVANHKTTGQKAAIKIMSTETIINSRMSVNAEPEEAERILQSIEREIVIMKLIEHPNVLSLLDVWEAKGLLFVVMEYVDGGELFDYLVERGRLPVPEALHYFQQIIYGVAYCHQFRIAHRDLKPENILLDKEKNVKVADFGMAAFVPRNSLLYTSCGSPHYASPEVVSGLAYRGDLSDVWSCGVILYALLAGRLPFEDEDLRGLLDKVREGKYSIPIDVPWPAQNLIRRMMEKDSERRIAVSEILNHPFFRSVLPRSPPVFAPSFMGLVKTIPAGCESKSIDGGIIKNMRTLWRNRQDEDVIRAIRNKDDNWEKIVYHLLYEFRMKRLSSIGSDDGARKHRHHRKSRRRSSRAPTGNTSREDGSGTTGSPKLERPSAPTPTRARSTAVIADSSLGDQPASTATAPLTPRKRAKTSTSGSGQLPSIVVHQATPGNEGARTLPDDRLDDDMRLDPKTIRVDSPLLAGPDVQEDLFFQQIAEMLVNMSSQDDDISGKPASNGAKDLRELKVPASEVAAPPTTPTSPVFQDVDSFVPPPRLVEPTVRMVPPFNVLTPVNVDKPAQHRSLKDRVNPPRSILTKPTQAKENVLAENGYEHARVTEGQEPSRKRVHIVTPDPSTFERPRRRSHSASRDEARSDNWFTNLFHFKSSRQEFYSVHDVFSTRERCISSLRALGTRVESAEPVPHTYGGGTLRCRIDEVVDPSGTVSVSKAVRFRVEIRPTTGARYAAGYLTELVLVQEKGQPGTFSAICDRFRRGWELDVTFLADGSMDVLTVIDGGLVSPALTVGGRYAEV